MTDCQLNRFERNKYFYGKLLSVRDFETEQFYMNGKRHLLNRLIHGSGVVCGLRVEKVENDNQAVRITPGVALDSWGREILVARIRGEDKSIGGISHQL